MVYCRHSCYFLLLEVLTLSSQGILFIQDPVPVNVVVYCVVFLGIHIYNLLCDKVESAVFFPFSNFLLPLKRLNLVPCPFSLLYPFFLVAYLKLLF
jgi:hypothetical protein